MSREVLLSGVNFFVPTAKHLKSKYCKCTHTFHTLSNIHTDSVWVYYNHIHVYSSHVEMQKSYTL